MTGVKNRTTMDNAIRREIELSRRHGSVMSVILLDIDHFKRINDRFGHLAGDQALRAVAQCAERTIRESDMLFRYGGEEFLVILPETDGQQATKSAERIRKAVKDSMTDYENNTLKVTVSIGVAVIQSTDNNENDLINRADDALYSAKGKGRDRVVLV